MSIRNDLLEQILAANGGGDVMTRAAFEEITQTYASFGYTQATATNEEPLIVPISVGTGTKSLTPPTSPQPLTGGDYRGYIKINGFVGIEESGSLSVSNGEVIIGVSGDYFTSNAWIDISSSVNTTTLGFLFSIERNGEYSFSGRPVGSRGFNGDNRTNVSGGGLLSGLQAGDKIGVWVASENISDVTIYDCNIAIDTRSIA